jgi:hypothetical protein
VTVFLFRKKEKPELVVGALSSGQLVEGKQEQARG